MLDISAYPYLQWQIKYANFHVDVIITNARPNPSAGLPNFSW